MFVEEKTDIQGWSLFSHIERPHAAMVMRDPLDLIIRGVRYQITDSLLQDTSGKEYCFSFESWCYKARGPIKHQNVLSFALKDRQDHDPRVSKYLSNLRVFNRPVEMQEDHALSALKAAARIIEHIQLNQNFDVFQILQKYNLTDNIPYLDDCRCRNNELMASSF